MHFAFGDATGTHGFFSLAQFSISDGKWHNMTLTVSDKVFLTVDDVNRDVGFSARLHRFLSSDLDYIKFGSSDIPTYPSSFDGCIGRVNINGNEFYLSSSTSLFIVESHGKTGVGCRAADVCASSPCDGKSLSHCVDLWGEFECVAPGKCSPNPCKHQTRCVPSGGEYKCDCSRYNLTGTHCEVPFACLDQPCDTSEKCVHDMQKDYRCELIAVTEKSEEFDKYLIIIIVLICIVLLALIIGFCAAKRRKALLKMSESPATLKNADGLQNYGLEYDDYLGSMGNVSNGIHSSNEAFFIRKSHLDISGSTVTVSDASRDMGISQPDLVDRGHRAKDNWRSLPMHASDSVIDQNSRAHPAHKRQFRSVDEIAGYTQGRSRNHVTQSHDNLASMHVGGNFKLISDAPVESGFESTGSDLNSIQEHRNEASTEISTSMPPEAYDLDNTSIGFSEMSFQQETNSSAHNSSHVPNKLRFVSPVKDSPASYYNISSVSASDFTPEVEVTSPNSDTESTGSDASFTCSECDYDPVRPASRHRHSPAYVLSRLDKNRNLHSAPASMADSSSSINGSFSSLTSPLEHSHPKHPHATSPLAQPVSPAIQVNKQVPVNRTAQSKPNGTRKKKKRREQGIADLDPILNWSLKYNNLAEVYRELGSLSLLATTDALRNEMAVLESAPELADSLQNTPEHVPQDPHRTAHPHHFSGIRNDADYKGRGDIEMAYKGHVLEDVPESDAEVYL